MLMSSDLKTGAIAIGNTGIGYPVTQIEGDRLVLKTPDGLKRVPWSAVIRWELPPPRFQPGQKIEVFFPHKQRWRSGYRFLGYSQEWTDRAWLQCPEGHQAQSKLEFLRGEL
jgi:hypothetical protein